MNLEEVIARFESEHKGTYSKSDRETIVAAINSLGLTDFFISYRKDLKMKDGTHYSTYFRDEADVVHVHPTMIVARVEFKGSDPTNMSKFPRYPHMAQLSSWITKDDHSRPICPHCFVDIPLINLCGICGFDIEDVGEE